MSIELVLSQGGSAWKISGKQEKHKHLNFSQGGFSAADRIQKQTENERTWMMLNLIQV